MLKYIVYSKIETDSLKPHERHLKINSLSQHLGGRGRLISKFKTSRFYSVSSRTARAIQRNPVWKKQNKTKKNKTKKNKQKTKQNKTTKTLNLYPINDWETERPQLYRCFI